MEHFSYQNCQLYRLVPRSAARRRGGQRAHTRLSAPTEARILRRTRIDLKRQRFNPVRLSDRQLAGQLLAWHESTEFGRYVMEIRPPLHLQLEQTIERMKMVLPPERAAEASEVLRRMYERAARWHQTADTTDQTTTLPRPPASPGHVGVLVSGEMFEFKN
jgi:hypothetical protein